MSEPLVIDASAGVEFLLNSPTGMALRGRMPSPAEEWAPEIYVAEVAAALRRAELFGRLSPERAGIAITRLLAAPLRRVEVQPLLSDAWQLRHNLTVSDALYVVLARHLGATLVTADRKLAGAPGIGVPVIAP